MASNALARSSRAASFLSPSPLRQARRACFAREVLRRLDGFDESYGSYLEDVDLGLRCLREGLPGRLCRRGRRVAPRQRHSRALEPAVVRLISRNQVLLIARHYDRALFQNASGRSLPASYFGDCVAVRHGAAFAWAAGKWEGLRHFRLEGQPNARVREFFSASEREIQARATGSYWRWYFLLTFRDTSGSGPGAAH